MVFGYPTHKAFRYRSVFKVVSAPLGFNDMFNLNHLYCRLIAVEISDFNTPYFGAKCINTIEEEEKIYLNLTLT